MTRPNPSRDFQDAILDPLHSAVTLYGTQTLHYWVNNTLRINYLTSQTASSSVERLRRQKCSEKKEGEKVQKLETPFELTAASSLRSGDRIPRTCNPNHGVWESLLILKLSCYTEITTYLRIELPHRKLFLFYLTITCSTKPEPLRRCVKINESVMTALLK